MSIIISFAGCNNKFNKQTITKSSEENKIQFLNLTVNDVERLPDSIFWSGGGSFYCLAFEPEEVHFIFNPTCAYWFPSTIINNELVFYWKKNEDCIFDRGLSKRFNGIDNPEYGKPFGKIKLLDDSTLFIDYYYSDWVKKINIEESETIDTLFPFYFKKAHW